MGQREEAAVGRLGGQRGRRGPALVQEVWVEPKSATRWQRGRIAAISQSRLLDNQLTVL